MLISTTSSAGLKHWNLGQINDLQGWLELSKLKPTLLIERNCPLRRNSLETT